MVYGDSSEKGAAASVVRAKARARRRTKDAGAVMFIVAMTLAVIAAMGIYALNVAATEIKTAGFVREQMQTQYLSEYAVIGATNTVAGQNAGMFAIQARTSPATNCMSLYGIPAAAGALPLSCRTLGSTQMGAMWSPPPPPLLAPWGGNATETTRGSVGLPTTPDFYVELTEPYQVPVSRCARGFDTTQLTCCIDFTVTAVGFSQGTAGSFLTEGLEMSRSRIIAGPTSFCPPK
jgi:hypothetical protein